MARYFDCGGCGGTGVAWSATKDQEVPCPACDGKGRIKFDEPAEPVKPIVGQVWEDRGSRVTVETIKEGGGAVVKDADGLRHPVQASYFKRARLLSDESELTK
jgi:RecJ-like exonuclease